MSKHNNEKLKSGLYCVHVRPAARAVWARWLDFYNMLVVATYGRRCRRHSDFHFRSILFVFILFSSIINVILVGSLCECCIAVICVLISSFLSAFSLVLFLTLGRAYCRERNRRLKWTSSEKEMYEPVILQILHCPASLFDF